MLSLTVVRRPTWLAISWAQDIHNMRILCARRGNGDWTVDGCATMDAGPEAQGLQLESVVRAPAASWAAGRSRIGERQLYETAVYVQDLLAFILGEPEGTRERTPRSAAFETPLLPGMPPSTTRPEILDFVGEILQAATGRDEGRWHDLYMTVDRWGPMVGAWVDRELEEELRR